MPLATRGRTRDLYRACKINDNLHYGFKTADLSTVVGVSSGDITALGQVPLTGLSTLVVFSPQSPKPAMFRKKLTGSTQDSITAFGDGSSAASINTAAGAGWTMTRGIRGCSFGSTTKSKAVAIVVQNGLLVKRMVPIGDAGNASALGWQTTLTAADRKKLVYAPKGKVALVSQPSGNSTITLPCSYGSIETATAEGGGWKLARPESGFEGASIAIP